MANLFQPSLQRATDSNGRPVSGAKMYFFLTGTTTAATWFTDQAGLVQGTNPLTADSSGKFTTPAYLDPDTTYRVRLTTNDGATLVWPDVDPVRGYDEGMIQRAADDAITASASAVVSAAAAEAAQGAAEDARDDAETAASAATAARDATLLTANLFPSTAAALGNGVSGYTALVAGSGGTNGTFPLVTSGGTQVVAAVGTFTVSGGAVTAIVVSRHGYYSSNPTGFNFSASAGLTGASATPTVVANTVSGEYFQIPSADTNGYVDLYLNNAGSAVLQDTMPNTLLVDELVTDAITHDLSSYGQTTVVANGIASSAGSSRWITAAIGEDGFLVGLTVACELSGTGKILLLTPNGGNWDGAAAFSYAFAVGVNTLTQAQIETAAGGPVAITSTMRLGVYAATAMFSTYAGGAGTGTVAALDMAGQVNHAAAGTTAQPALNASVRIVSPTSIGDKVDDLTNLQEANQSEIDDNASDIERLQSVVGPLLTVAMADASDAGGVVSGAFWGVDEDSWQLGIDIGAGQDVDITTDQVIGQVRLPVSLTDADLVKLRVTLWLREQGITEIDNKLVQPDDFIIGPTVYDIDDLGLTAGSSGEAVIPIPEGFGGAFAIDKRLILTVEGYATDGTTRKTFRIGRSTSYGSVIGQGLRGRFGNGNVNSNVSSPNRNAMTVDVAGAGDADILSAPTALLPDKLYLTSGYPLPFYFASMFDTQVRDGAFDVSVQSLKYAPGSVTATTPTPPLSKRVSMEAVEIDANAITTSITVTARDRSADAPFYQKTIPVTKAAWVKTGSPVILCFGDSLAHQYKMAALSQELVARGLSPTFLGDLTTTWNSTTVANEGRGGKSMADYMYRRIYSSGDVNTMKPCVAPTAITHAAYIALPASGSAGVDAIENRNPFLVASGAAGSHNGFLFSAAQYQTFTGCATPTHVFISLGTNDILQLTGTTLATTLTNLATDYAQMIANIRAAWPNAYICVYCDGLGIWPASDGTFSSLYQMRQVQQKAVADLVTAGDTKLHWMPLGLHEDAATFGSVTVNSTDTHGLGEVEFDSTLAGWLHPNGTNILNAANALASYVAATS